MLLLFKRSKLNGNQLLSILITLSGKQYCSNRNIYPINLIADPHLERAPVAVRPKSTSEID